MNDKKGTESHPLDWSLESSRHLIEDRWLSLRHDVCRTPGGRTVDPYYVFEFPDWVNVVAVTERNEVVLVKQYRHGIGRTLLELPSGAVEESDESPRQTAERELLEETGYRGSAIVRCGALSANPATHDNLGHSFLVTGCRRVAEPTPEENEELEVVLVPLEELPALALAGEFLQALHVGAIWFALSKLGRPTVDRPE